ncbi:MAG: LCP family protein [Fimbriimonadaceae bacterium]|nr:LCP family protein [Fimbriimonadaceae bacterium]
MVGKPAMGETLKQFIFNVQPEDVFRDEFGPKDHLIVLVLGVDSDISNRKMVVNDAARSDMLMLTRLDFKNNAITGLSIPRDILMSLRGSSREHRINAFHRIGGREMAQRAVEELTGVKIDRVVTLDYAGLQALVDSVGGISLNVEKDMKYDDFWGGLHIDLKAGEQHLNGYEAMGFVRFRHDDDDIARQKRQRDFMLAYQQRLVQHPQFVPAVIELAANQTKDAFSTNEFAALLNFALAARGQSVQMDTVPVIYPGQGKTYLLIDKEKLPDTLLKYGFERDLELVDQRGRSQRTGRRS